jgi:hypothetical protein
LGQVHVLESQDEPNNVNYPHYNPNKEGLDEEFCDCIDFLFIKTENVVDECFGACVLEHLLDPDAGGQQFEKGKDDNNQDSDSEELLKDEEEDFSGFGSPDIEIGELFNNLVISEENSIVHHFFLEVCDMPDHKAEPEQ